MDYRREREEMVEKQLRRRGIVDERVLAAMRDLPREEFVPENARHLAYDDNPVNIGSGQTISQPFMTALMAQSLELRGEERVLEIGAGSGYAAAVLGALAGSVASIELLPELAAFARDNLERTGRLGNVQVLCGDGSLGFRPGAPYNGISVAAGAPDVPAALLEQLTDPGLLVIPVGDFNEQELRVLALCGGKVSSRIVTGCRFVPLLGWGGWR